MQFNRYDEVNIYRRKNYIDEDQGNYNKTSKGTNDLLLR